PAIVSPLDGLSATLHRPHDLHVLPVVERNLVPATARNHLSVERDGHAAAFLGGARGAHHGTHRRALLELAALAIKDDVHPRLREFELAHVRQHLASGLEEAEHAVGRDRGVETAVLDSRADHHLAGGTGHDVAARGPHEPLRERLAAEAEDLALYRADRYAGQ